MEKIRRIAKTEKGVTLIALIITLLILVILTFTITVNTGQIREIRTKTNFTKDITSLNEEVSQYYIRTKTLPIINEFRNVSMLDGIKNVNDNDKYYIIDIKQLDVKLYYGKDYDYVKTVDESLVFPGNTSFTDLYIINEQSHTIYYPKGIEYDGTIHYTSDSNYSNVKNKQNVT